jgi:hypothetical protein
VRAEWCSGLGVLMKSWSLVLALFAGSCALAQEPSPVFRGTWTATAGPTQVLRGTWSAQTSPANQNVARGSWTLLNDAGEIFLEGTWSAQKTGQGLQGTWTARPTKGQSLSGSWTAVVANLITKSLAQMLKSTATKEVAGSWRSGSYQGDWWLKGSALQGRSP